MEGENKVKKGKRREREGGNKGKEREKGGGGDRRARKVYS